MDEAAFGIPIRVDSVKQGQPGDGALEDSN
jgi:hypothetical protein